MSIKNTSDMEEAIKIISKLGSKSVLLKGGHMINDANDLLFYNNECIWINGKRINNTNTHGTGCTLSSAIASNLAKDYDMVSAIKRSKYYLSTCLMQMLDLGAGSGPMDHGWNFKEIEIE